MTGPETWEESPPGWIIWWTLVCRPSGCRPSTSLPWQILVTISLTIGRLDRRDNHSPCSLTPLIKRHRSDIWNHGGLRRTRSWSQKERTKDHHGLCSESLQQSAWLVPQKWWVVVGSYQNDLYLKIHSFEEAREEPYTDYYIWRDAKDLDPSKKR